MASAGIVSSGHPGIANCAHETLHSSETAFRSKSFLLLPGNKSYSHKSILKSTQQYPCSTTCHIFETLYRPEKRPIRCKLAEGVDNSSFLEPSHGLRKDVVNEIGYGEVMLMESVIKTVVSGKKIKETDKLEEILSSSWKLVTVAGCTALLPVILSVSMLSIFLPDSGAGAVEVVSEGVSAVSVSSSIFALAPEPANALSLPTWIIHVASVVEWVFAMVLVWRYGEREGREGWKSLSWGMVPLLGGAMCACTWHFFYNAPSLEILVVLQGALTVVGNCTLWLAAYRIFTKSQEKKFSS